MTTLHVERGRARGGDRGLSGRPGDRGAHRLPARARDPRDRAPAGRPRRRGAGGRRRHHPPRPSGRGEAADDRGARQPARQPPAGRRGAPRRPRRRRRARRRCARGSSGSSCEAATASWWRCATGPSSSSATPAQVRAKWIAATRVLADPEAAGATYIDVRLPGRPAAGGLPAATLALAPGGHRSWRRPRRRGSLPRPTVDPATEQLAPPAADAAPAAAPQSAPAPAPPSLTPAPHGLDGRGRRSPPVELTLNRYLSFTPTLQHCSSVLLHNFLRGRLTLPANSA